MDDSTQGPHTSARKTIWSVLSTAFVIIFLAGCLFYAWSHRQDFSFLEAASLHDVFVAGGLVLLSYLINSYQLGLFLARLGLALGTLELLALTMSMMLGNLVIPMRGGSGGLAVYLKAVHNFDFASFGVIYGGTALLMGLINAGLAFIALVYLSCVHDFREPLLLIFSAALFAGIAYLVFWPPPIPWRRKGILEVLFRISNAWRLISMDKPLMRALILSTAGIVLSLFWAFWFIYRATDSHISFLGIVVTTSLGNIANLVPFTPGSLGIFDAAVIQVPLLFRLDLARSMAATFIFRALCFGWALLFGLPAALYMAHRMLRVHNP